MAGEKKAGFSTPYFLVDENRLLHNLEILKQVSEQAGCKILLAQKAFSTFSAYPLLRVYGNIWQEPQPAACMRPDWAMRNLERKPMCFLLPIQRRNFRGFCSMQTT